MVMTNKSNRYRSTSWSSTKASALCKAAVGAARKVRDRCRAEGNGVPAEMSTPAGEERASPPTASRRTIWRRWGGLRTAVASTKTSKNNKNSKTSRNRITRVTRQTRLNQLIRIKTASRGRRRP